ncbi:unnamed protein product [Lathyrus oleraceus]|uniref:uncharacterized protein LOC127098660 n=1 Tax=Pisum sativum TaxID=3888 RepID=UPI0021D30D67|nr:uncharacterized protein LOC127098660 [Pisum sativum]
MARDSDRMDLHAGDVLFGQENDVFGFESSTWSNVNLGVSFSETLIGDVGGVNGSTGLFSGTDEVGFQMNSGCNVSINGGEKEGFYPEKINGLADGGMGGMLGVVDGRCDGKVGKLSSWLVQNEVERTVIQSTGGGCAESGKDLVFGLNNGVQIEQEREDVAKVAEGSLEMEDLFSRKSFLSDAQVNEIQNYMQYNYCGLDLVVDLNSYKNTQEDNDNVARDSVFSDVNYRVSDLVWGKVRGHPWWPGQIYDPSIASEMAKSYWEENCYLIAYFGGQKFAWNEVSMIKPFHKHFSEMAKQTGCESFRFAVDCALEEASRRVAFGLSCSCMPEEVSSNLKTQVVANGEICKQSFEPAELVSFVQSLAQSPLNEFDRLDLVNARGQVSAFYRSKGYSQLPEFAVHDRLFVPDMETLPVREDEQCNDLVLKTGECFLPDLISEKNSWTPNGECTLEKKAGDNPTSRRGRKRKVSHDTSYHYFQIEDEKSTCRRGRKPKAAYNTSDDCFQNFQIAVNNSIPRKRGRKPKLANNTSDDCFQNFQIAVNNSTPRKRGRKPKLACNTYDNCFNNSQTGNSTEFQNVSVGDMWSQLCLAAKDPAGESCNTDLIHYFAAFRKVTGRNNSAFLEQGFSLEQRCDGETGVIAASIETAASASVSTPMEIEVEASAVASVSKELGVIEAAAVASVSKEFGVTEAAAVVSVLTPMEGGVIKSMEAAATASVLTPMEIEIEAAATEAAAVVSMSNELGVIEAAAVASVSTPIKLGVIESAAEASVSTPMELGVITTIEAAAEASVSTPMELGVITCIEAAAEASATASIPTASIPTTPCNDCFSGPTTGLLQDGNLISEPFNHVEQNLRAEPMVEHTSTSEEAAEISFSTGLIHQNTVENLASEPPNQVEHASESSPTAFTLKFTNFDSVPSATDLIQIFARFGPLIESKTELLERTKCVKVVFKRRIDAESAFCSAGQYNIFGPSLKSYRLKILPPMPKKAPGKKRRRRSKKEIASMKAAAV